MSLDAELGLLRSLFAFLHCFSHTRCISSAHTINSGQIWLAQLSFFNIFQYTLLEAIKLLQALKCVLASAMEPMRVETVGRVHFISFRTIGWYRNGWFKTQGACIMREIPRL